MATYVTLYNFTDQGIKNIKDTVKRAEAAKKAGAAMGATVKEVLWTLGQYDISLITEAPAELAGGAPALTTLKQAHYRGQAPRAFTAGETPTILVQAAQPTNALP